MDLDLVLKIIASKRRREILRWLVEPKQHFPPQKDGDLIKDGVCGLLIARKLHVSQPTASDHLNVMVRARMLRAKRIKQWTFYKRDERVISRIRKQMVKSL
jgi:DNA-binding transcriptional ArsR family regulator